MNKERNHHTSAHECGRGEEVLLSQRPEMPLLTARNISHGAFQVTPIMYSLFVLLCGAPIALQAESLENSACCCSVELQAVRLVSVVLPSHSISG